MNFKDGDKIKIVRLEGSNDVVGKCGGYYLGDVGVFRRIHHQDRSVCIVDFDGNRKHYFVDINEIKRTCYNKRKLTSSRLPK